MSYNLFFLSLLISFIVLFFNGKFFSKKSFIKYSIILSTFFPFYILGYGKDYKSVCFMSILYVIVSILEEKKQISQRTFYFSITVITFFTVFVGLNEIIFNDAGLLTLKIDIFKTIITALWIIVTILLFRTINFFNGIVAIISFIVSVFSFSIYLKTNFMSQNILFLMNLFIGGLIPIIMYNFPPAKISLKDSDATLVGYIFSIFLVYSVNYSIVYTGILIPLLMVFIPILFLTLVVAFSYGKKFYISSETNITNYKWNITEKSFVIFITIFTLYLSLLVYFIYKGSSNFLIIMLLVMFVGILYITGKFLFLKQQPAEIKETIEILGIRIDNCKFESAIEKVFNLISLGKKFYITTPNSISVYECKFDKKFKKIVNNSKLNIPDGIGLIWAADFNHTPILSRIPGIDFMNRICQKASYSNLNIYLLGSKSEIVKNAVIKLNEKYPNIKICGYHDGYFSKDKEDEIISEINALKTDILFVAMGVPTQEKWIYDNFDKINAKCMMGVGGSFDVISGNLKRAPEIMQKFGFEWLFRLFQEPNRFARILTLPMFIKEVLFEFLKQHKK